MFNGYFTKSTLSVTDADPKAEAVFPDFTSDRARLYHADNRVGR